MLHQEVANPSTTACLAQSICFTRSRNLSYRRETLTTVHQILKCMDVLTCMKGVTIALYISKRLMRLYSLQLPYKLRRFPIDKWIKVSSRHKPEQEYMVNLVHKATTLIQHRICVIQSMVGTPNVSIQQRYEMSGPLTHTAPASIVHCLWTKVKL